MHSTKSSSPLRLSPPGRQVPVTPFVDETVTSSSQQRTPGSGSDERIETTASNDSLVFEDARMDNSMKAKSSNDQGGGNYNDDDEEEDRRRPSSGLESRVLQKQEDQDLPTTTTTNLLHSQTSRHGEEECIHRHRPTQEVSPPRSSRSLLNLFRTNHQQQKFHMSMPGRLDYQTSTSSRYGEGIGIVEEEKKDNGASINVDDEGMIRISLQDYQELLAERDELRATAKQHEASINELKKENAKLKNGDANLDSTGADTTSLISSHVITRESTEGAADNPNNSIEPLKVEVLEAEVERLNQKAAFLAQRNKTYENTIQELENGMVDLCDGAVDREKQLQGLLVQNPWEMIANTLIFPWTGAQMVGYKNLAYLSLQQQKELVSSSTTNSKLEVAATNNGNLPLIQNSEPTPTQVSTQADIENAR